MSSNLRLETEVLTLCIFVALYFLHSQLLFVSAPSWIVSFLRSGTVTYTFIVFPVARSSHIRNSLKHDSSWKKSGRTLKQWFLRAEIANSFVGGDVQRIIRRKRVRQVVPGDCGEAGRVVSGLLGSATTV